jgi:hypothetical protein
MKKNAKALVQELKNTRYFKDLYKDNVIDMNDYFKDTTNQDLNSRLISLIPEYRQKKVIRTFTDMSIYKLDKRTYRSTPIYKNIRKK